MEQFGFTGYTSSNMIMCYVDGENIVQQDYIGNRQVIGKTAQAYNDLQTTAQQYYDKLVELGVIIPPKSQEEMMGEMQKTMKDMADIISSLSNQVKELKDHGSEQRACRCEENVSQRESKRGGGKGAGSDQRDGEQP